MLWSASISVNENFNTTQPGTHMLTLNTDLEAWLFVDGILAMDLGGLHGPQCQHVIFEDVSENGKSCAAVLVQITHSSVNALYAPVGCHACFWKCKRYAIVPLEELHPGVA